MNKLNKLLKEAPTLNINNASKIVIMSDIHRGIGNNSDNFIKNRNIFAAALNSYFKKGFIYIELGDGDDMWEVKNYNEIIKEHIDIFKILKKFHQENRLIMLFGNHDKCKSSKVVLEKYFYQYKNTSTNKEETLLENVSVKETILLKFQNHDLFLVHGHQGDFLNDNLWKLSRFLVRYIWKNLELIGVNDPTSAAKNNKVKNSVEKRLKKWSLNNQKILIAGHTHRAIYPTPGQSLYFNDGSCVNPDGITCIEIENSQITLVKWYLNVKEDNAIYVERKIMNGPTPILEFFYTNK